MVTFFFFFKGAPWCHICSTYDPTLSSRLNFISTISVTLFSELSLNVFIARILLKLTWQCYKLERLWSADLLEFFQWHFLQKIKNWNTNYPSNSSGKALSLVAWGYWWHFWQNVEIPENINLIFVGANSYSYLQHFVDNITYTLLLLSAFFCNQSFETFKKYWFSLPGVKL